MKKTKIILILFFSLFLVLFTSFSLSRFYSLQIFYYDFGIFSQIIWQLSRFQIPYIDHRVLGNIVFLGDHFNPSLIILAPLFWFTSNLKVLLVEQALVTVLSGFLVYLIARKLKFSTLISLIFATVFLLFAGTENPLVTDWHPESTAGFFLILFFYLFNFTKYRKLSYLSAFIFLGFKESNALTLIFLLIWLWFINVSRSSENIINKRPIENWIPAYAGMTNKRKEIVFLSIFSLLWFFITTKMFIPFFAHQPYMYSPELPKSPIQFITNYFNSPLKTKLIFDSFISFGFLPIFSLIGLIPVILELGIRLIPNSSIFQSFNLTFHYNVYLGIFLALATIYGVKNIVAFTSLRGVKRRSNPSKVRLTLMGLLRFARCKAVPVFARNDVGRFILLIIIGYLLLISLFTARKITNSPINFAVSKIFWQELKPRNDIFNEIKLVPKTGSVMSQNNLLSLFVKRKEKLIFLKENYETYKPDVIVLDLTPGQNPNNFWDANYETAQKLETKLILDKNYARLKTKNKNLFIFIKQSQKINQNIQN